MLAERRINQKAMRKIYVCSQMNGKYVREECVMTHDWGGN